MLREVETRVEGVARGAGGSKSVAGWRTSVTEDGKNLRKGLGGGCEVEQVALTLARRTKIHLLIAYGGRKGCEGGTSSEKSLKDTLFPISRIFLTPRRLIIPMLMLLQQNQTSGSTTVVQISAPERAN